MPVEGPPQDQAGQSPSEISATAPLSEDGTRSLPYWSTRARAQRAADIWGHGLRVDALPLAAWRDVDLPDVARAGYMIGINWAGPRLVGWSFTPAEALNRLAAVR
ncbi:DUF2750 domain-containing protein [Streptomyces parvus]|uniref:DUF2750 domain-containing protein n=1 Tax=Streptomyces parvus TaxID=66428 RepID=UPI0033ECDCA7